MTLEPLRSQSKGKGIARAKYESLETAEVTKVGTQMEIGWSMVFMTHAMWNRHAKDFWCWNNQRALDLWVKRLAFTRVMMSLSRLSV